MCDFWAAEMVRIILFLSVPSLFPAVLLCLHSLVRACSQETCMKLLCLEQTRQNILCVAVARLRRPPAVSREDRRGAELLRGSDEVCFCGCGEESEFVFVKPNVFLYPSQKPLIHTNMFHSFVVLFKKIFKSNYYFLSGHSKTNDNKKNI